ncbi:uncharacterized protein [Leptinotarsa decemlineata]|uniref:uncharacterized protein n=1 Tax=Leptinotarsa decemlineata TaxID=7539 RepID=UPI003D3088C5
MKSSEFKNDDCVKTLEENLSKQKSDIRKALPGERLEDVLTSALQCPVCLTRIIPPIPECTNGHQICFRCCSRVKNCPVCRGQNVAQENRFLVKIFERLDIRCKNAVNGCQIHKKGRYIVYHENVCEFAFRSCPLRATDKCKWEGFKSDLVHHCMREHADMISSESENRWELRGFKNQKRPQFNLLYAHDVVFRCGWERYGLSKRFSVNHIVDENDPTSYTFDLKIVKPGTDIVFMVSSGVCFPVSNFRFISVTTSYIVLSKKNILDFCDINGNLSYIIKINKNV